MCCDTHISHHTSHNIPGMQLNPQGPPQTWQYHRPLMQHMYALTPKGSLCLMVPRQLIQPTI